MEITATKRFSKEIKRLIKKYQSLVDDYENLLEEITQNPTLGTPLGNNCYKIRLKIASKNKGKSGGARVITYLYVQEETIFLLSIYDKSEKENITEKELKNLLDELEME